MFNQAKHYLLLKAINHKIKRVGIMLNLNIDSKEKTIDFSVLLVGEEAPLDVKVKSYEIKERDGINYLKLGEIETSKVWLNIVLDEFAKGDEVEISSKFSKLLKIVL